MKEVNFNLANRIGMDGQSAYEIDVAHGFEGSKEEWLAALKEPALTAAQLAVDATGNAISATQSAISAAENALLASRNVEFYEIAFTEGRYINQTGGTTANSGYSVSDFVRVGEGDMVYYTGTSGAATYAIFAYDDCEGKNPRAILGNNDSWSNHCLTIPEGVEYIRISGRNQSFGSLTVPVSAKHYPKFYRQISGLAVKTEDARKRLLVDIDFSKGFGLKPDGDTLGNLLYSITDYIPVTEGMLIEYSGIATAPNYSVGAYYDGNMNAISSLGERLTAEPVHFSVPAGAAYVRLAGRNEDHATSGGTPVRASVSGKLQRALDEISRIRSAMDFNENYYRRVDFPHKSYTTTAGTFTAIATFSRSDFMKVTPGDTVKFGGCQGAVSVGIACYTQADESSFVCALVGPSENVEVSEFTIPEGINYIVMCGKNSEYSPEPPIRLYGLVKTSIQDDIENIRTDLSERIARTGLEGKRLSVIGDSLSAGESASEIIITLSDCGKNISAYPTYTDIGKVIGGLPITPDMVGELTGFIPSAEDIGKKIGETGGAESVGERWWKVLCRETGMVKLQNVSQNSACLTSLYDSEPSLRATYAWHPSVVRRCAARDGDGNTVVPDVIVIYRGTNDFSKYPYAKLTGLGVLSTDIPETDTLEDNSAGFKEAYCITIGKLRESYPEATIFICTLPAFKRVNYSKFPVNNGVNTLPEFNKAIREVAELTGCGLIELDKCGITFENVSRYTSDLTHLNPEGHMLAGKKAAADILKY